MQQLLFRKIDIAPLVSFRIIFGAVALGGMLWSVYKGDITERYQLPQFHFKYYAWEWVSYPGDTGVILLYVLAILGATGILLGAFYRLSVLFFGFSFAYLHSIDSSNFINHYYLIVLISFLLFWVPAQGAYSLDRYWGYSPALNKIARWQILIFRWQLAIVYICAGIAKLNPDWLFRAMPLKIWLLQSKDFPLLGSLFSYNEVHFGFSWLAAFYDLSIVFWLSWHRSRPWAYAFVLAFHLLSAFLFDIGLFPPLMIGASLVFFPPTWHKIILERLLGKDNKEELIAYRNASFGLISLLFSHFCLQLFLPFRHLFFSSENILWTQDYYRYGWRVMLVENEGLANFRVIDPDTKREWVIDNNDFLRPYQIKRMSVQPEHILQFAHFLGKHYAQKFQIERPQVKADVHVSFNGRISRRLIDPESDLMQQQNGWAKKDWVQ